MTGFRPRTVGPQHYRHFLLSFMPGEFRKLRPTGIHIFGCRYWADWLGPEIADGRGQIAVRYDTRDISCIYAQTATGEWLSIHLFSPREPFSLHEHNAIKRKLRIEGRATSDEEVIHQARLEQREIEEQASARTKAARRARERHQRGYESSQLVQIDHVVPLAYAWHSGASTWTDEQRVQFANDLGELLAVDGGLNQQKSADGPSNWMPPNGAFHCDYAVLWVTILDRYSLSIDPNDRSTLEGTLEGCDA